jgi:hypothetical protein
MGDLGYLILGYSERFLLIEYTSPKVQTSFKNLAILATPYIESFICLSV